MTPRRPRGRLVRSYVVTDGRARPTRNTLDLVTLLVAVPALILSGRKARSGSVRAHLVWLGVVAYAGYNYAFYLFGAALNALFLVYAAILAIALLGFGFGAVALIQVGDEVPIFRRDLDVRASSRNPAGAPVPRRHRG